MLTFVDGPAAGVTLACARAPLFLRVTERVVWAGEERWDALDQLGDAPKASEHVHVYVRFGSVGSVHYSGRDRQGRRFGRTEQTAEYRYVEAQPDAATVRDTARWRAWAEAARRSTQVEPPQA